MSNPFEDIENALAGATGFDAEISGIILGIALTITIVIALMWIIGGSSSRAGGQSGMFLIVALFGTGISALVGWFPLWIPVFLVILLVIAWSGVFEGSGSRG